MIKNRFRYPQYKSSQLNLPDNFQYIIKIDKVYKPRKVSGGLLEDNVQGTAPCSRALTDLLFFCKINIVSVTVRLTTGSQNLYLNNIKNMVAVAKFSIVSVQIIRKSGQPQFKNMISYLFLMTQSVPMRFTSVSFFH